MTKMLLQEVELWYVIPTIRREIVNNMLSKGLQQKQIAEKLGITGAAVSQYLKNKRALNVKFSKEEKFIIGLSTNKILEGGNSVAEIQKILNHLRETKFVCRIHSQKEKTPHKCDICFNHD